VTLPNVVVRDVWVAEHWSSVPQTWLASTKKSAMPRVVFPFHISFTEYVPACTVPVVDSIQLPVFSASSEIQVPPLELTSLCVEWPVPLSVTARLSASKLTVVPPPPPPLGATSA